ncbi:MAG: hypothetical protein H7Y03_00570 [Chitinophagaceae bacterium]|nr:hypothetical protein [Chitinophagaceae bacterium]
MKCVIVVLGLLLLTISAYSQKKEDSIVVKKRFLNNIFRQFRNSLTISKADSASKATVLNTKSESAFLNFEGKIIRRIETEEMGFEKTFTDTTKRIAYFGTKILNALHSNTKAWVIWDNLFIKEKTVLNAYEVADNERYLRSIDFIQDARILIRTVKGSEDSVDLIVVTKDLFSINGSLTVNGVSRARGRIAESNLGGMGQKLQVAVLYDKNRTPSMGYDVSYTKNSIGGSFINGTFGATFINTGPSEGLEDERSFYLALDRPLISPYSNLAGGFAMSYNFSQNLFAKPDSAFYNYKYNIYDGWIGVNIGADMLMASKNQNRIRKFISARYFTNHFERKPLQIGDKFDPIYNNKKGILGEITFFRQEFIKTNYIYGFGTTEDVPYGYNIAVTGGWYKQLDLGRPYAGINANKYVFTEKGEFFQYFLRSGAFFNRRRLEDASVLVGANLYSRLYVFKNFKLRDYLRFSYTNLARRVTSEPLRIDNPLGLRYFRSDSVLGSQRLSLYTETYLISDRKIFGFQLSPFVFGDLTFLAKEKSSLFKADLFSGLGGGIRTRNENFIFGTIELRMMYFPRTTEDMNSFKIRIKANLRFRYNSRYIKAPDLIQLNNDDANNVY